MKGLAFRRIWIIKTPPTGTNKLSEPLLENISTIDISNAEILAIIHIFVFEETSSSRMFKVVQKTRNEDKNMVIEPSSDFLSRTMIKLCGFLFLWSA